MEYCAGPGLNDSETKLTGDDVMVSKSHLEVCRGVTQTSDSLSSTSSSSPGSRHHPGQTSVRQDQSVSDPTPTLPDEKVLDMSEVALQVGCSVQPKHIRWENVDDDRQNGTDDISADNATPLSDYKTAVDLSTSKSFYADIDHKTSQRHCRLSSESDLDEPEDTANRRSSLLASKVLFSQPPVSLVHD